MTEEVLGNLDPRESFRRAKIEHYTERAEEFVHMARFSEARRTIDRVITLDPGNEVVHALRKTIDERFRCMTERSNGNGQPTNGNGVKPRRRELVLIVDQDEKLLTSLTDTLSRSGFQVIGAGTYDEAVEALGTVKPDIILSEVNFAQGSRGFDLYLWLRTNSGFMETPFMFLAARVDRDTLIAGKRFGVDDFILKPVDSEVITASIVNCLSRRRLVQK
jgi:PleD family two-component response regulator